METCWTHLWDCVKSGLRITRASRSGYHIHNGRVDALYHSAFLPLRRPYPSAGGASLCAGTTRCCEVSGVLRTRDTPDMRSLPGVGTAAWRPRSRHRGAAWCRNRCMEATLPTSRGRLVSEALHGGCTSDILGPLGVGSAVWVRHSRHPGAVCPVKLLLPRKLGVDAADQLLLQRIACEGRARGICQ